MIYLLDVNALMALLWEDHEHFERMDRWFRSVAKFATCPLTQLGFGRISSHPALGYNVSPDQAFTILRRFLATPRHQFIADDLSCEDRVVRTDQMTASPNVTDFYLIALARHKAVTIATLDEPLARSFRFDPNLVHLVGP